MVQTIKRVEEKPKLLKEYVTNTQTTFIPLQQTYIVSKFAYGSIKKPGAMK